eukprot:6459945-Prymnesium_polylepis.2
MLVREQVDIFLIDTLYDFAKPYAVNDRRLVRDGLIRPAPTESVCDCFPELTSQPIAIFVPPLLHRRHGLIRSRATRSARARSASDTRAVGGTIPTPVPSRRSANEREREKVRWKGEAACSESCVRVRCAEVSLRRW